MRDRANVDVREIMAAAEDVTRTIIGRTLDSISESALERSAKWLDAQETIDHLHRIRGAINNGEELVWAVVDFHLSQLPAPEQHVVKMGLSDEEYDALAEMGRAHGVTAAGYAQMLAQKAVLDLKGAKAAAANRKRPMLLVSTSQQQADQWIMRNAMALEGWSVVVHPSGGAGVEHLRGRQYEMVVLLTDVSRGALNELALLARLGDVPTLVRIPPDDGERFDPQAAIDQQARANLERMSS
jgi:hypothetical protein